jgi:hypothetical protein
MEVTLSAPAVSPSAALLRAACTAFFRRRDLPVDTATQLAALLRRPHGGDLDAVRSVLPEELTLTQRLGPASKQSA